MKKLLILFCLFFLYSYSNAQVDLQKGLVAYYPFNGNANDESGNGNNGTIHGGLTSTMNRFGIANSAYLFDGTSAYIDVPDANSLDLSSSMSISVWVRIDSMNSMYSINNGRIIEKGTAGHDNGYLLDAFYVGAVPCGTNTTKLRFIGGSASYSNGCISLGTWHNIVVTYDKGIVNYYFDGSKDLTTTITTIAIPTNNYPLRIGYTQGAEAGGYEYFKGAMDEVRIYNRVLSSDEVAQFTNTLSLENTKGLSTVYVGRTKSYSSTISYTLIGSFNSDNQVVAYLSDKNGNFTNAIQIGSVVSGSSGSINITIPAGMAEGTGYKIVLKTTSPVISSNESSAFTIILNDAPTNITLSNNHIAENQPIGSTIGTLQTTDLDTEDTFTYTALTSNSYFYIEGNTIKTNHVFDYETDPTVYTFEVKSTDPWGESYTKIFTITIDDVNEAPTSITLSNNHIAENEPIGTTIGSFQATDPDKNETFIYTFLTSVANFTIDGNTLKTNHIFDYETEPTIYTFNIKVTDKANASYVQIFTITIDNINEAPTLSLPSQTFEGKELVDISVNGFVINDVDVFSGNLQVGISTENSVLNFSQLSASEIKSGSQNSTSILFEANLSRVNQIINSLIVKADQYFYGIIPITIKVSDMGNSGSGGTQTVEKILTINILPSPPTITLQPVSQIKGCVNDIAVFSICADGSRPIEYQWYKDGSILYSERNNFISIAITGDTDAGAYYCTVKNISGEVVSNQGVLLVKSQNFKASIVDVTLCTGDPAGSISISATGGWGDYLYSIDNGTHYSTTQVYDNLHVGTYSVVIKDNNNCTTFKDFTVTAPPLLKPNINAKNIACKDYKNGELNIKVVGGTPPFVLDIHSKTLNEILSFNTNEENRIYTHLIPDLYTINIKDQNACDTFAVVRLTEPEKLVFTSKTSSVTCYGDHDGDLDFSISGGTEPYWFYWTNNEMTNLIKDFKSGTYNLSEVAKTTGLLAGEYDFYITDSQSCYTSENVEIDSPKKLEASFVDNSLIASGGTLPYEYSENGRSFSTTNTFNLSNGIHYLVVRDSKGCLAKISQYVESKTITETKPVVDFMFYSQGLVLNVVGTVQGNCTYVWDFGDGTYVNDTEVLTHHYSQLGTYQVSLTAYNSAGTSRVEKTVQIVNQDLTDISNETPTDFTIYPNPATDEIFIAANQNKSLEISILDASGRKVLETKNLHISVKSLSSGFYIVQLKNNNGIYTKKLIIK